MAKTYEQSGQQRGHVYKLGTPARRHRSSCWCVFHPLYSCIQPAAHDQLHITMPTPNHTPRSSRHTIPPRLTVPPFPPQLYRRLLLTVEKDGLLLRPQHPTGGEDDNDVRTDDSTGVLIRWGAKGKLETWEQQQASDEDEGVVLGGILGIVRLWDGESTSCPPLTPSGLPFGVPPTNHSTLSPIPESCRPDTIGR
jgi:hypothetical protein